MKVIKPLKLGILHRCYENQQRFHLGVSMFAFVPLGKEPGMFTDISMWKFLAEELGKDTVLDAGIPKAHPEFLVTGKAFVPEGKAATGVAVRACLGDREKVLHVFGDRYWNGSAASDPAPFSEMPLDWEHAFGGEGCLYNPLGKGFSQVDPETGNPWWLPNIENPNQRLTFKDQRPEPATFGPMDIMWPQRSAMAGTHDQQWLENHFPGYAPDMDWRIFNLAARDQQFDHPLQGNETYQLDYMHPDKPRVEGQLPGITARCYINRKTGSAESFEEIPAYLTTVWFFPHAERAVLIYQGVAEIQEEDGSDVLQMMIAAERTGEPRGLDHYRKVLGQRLDKEKGHLYVLRDSDLMPPGLKVSDPDFEAELKIVEPENLLMKNMRNRAELQHEKVRQELIGQGLDPDDCDLEEFPPEEDAPDLENLAEYMEKVEAKVADSNLKREQKEKEHEQFLKNYCAENNIEFDEFVAKNKVAAAAPPELAVDQRIAGLKEEGEKMRAAGVDAETVEKAVGTDELHQEWRDGEEKLKGLYRLGAHEQDAPAQMSDEESNRVRDEVKARLAAGQSLAESKLTGANLSDMNLSGADFTGAYLAGANLNGANMEGVNLTNAILAHASLKGTRLTGAVLVGANLGSSQLTHALVDGNVDARNTILSRADLSGTCFRGARLDGASLMEVTFNQTDFSEVQAEQLLFMECDFKNTSFVKARLPQSIFLKTDISGSDFSGAHLDAATFVGIKGQSARFCDASMDNVRFVDECNLVSVDFSRANLNKSNLRGSLLSGCNLQEAQLNDADLSECDLRNARLYRVSAKNTLMINADLSGAEMTSINLMNAVVQRSTIQGANLSGANLYAADFARVLADNATQFVDANMNKVRMHPKRFRQ
ncbi:Pentapeptide repeat family protein [hydrothermal vent metagenome]|uniref:Pentapeptide repeat family protein n=1 Tax=hydrothermal vent metagenome TaxID=652676 RepID=A0A3B0Z7C8_9ZZZZ